MHINDAYEHEPILPYIPEKDDGPGTNCRKNVEQCVDVSAKLNVSPTTNVGAAMAACQGEPRVACVTNEGGGSVTLTVTQKVRVTVPICFGVTVEPEEPRVACAGREGAPCGC